MSTVGYKHVIEDLWGGSWWGMTYSNSFLARCCLYTHTIHICDSSFVTFLMKFIRKSMRLYRQNTVGPLETDWAKFHCTDFLGSTRWEANKAGYTAKSRSKKAKYWKSRECCSYALILPPLYPSICSSRRRRGICGVFFCIVISLLAYTWAPRPNIKKLSGQPAYNHKGGLHAKFDQFGPGSWLLPLKKWLGIL